MKRFVLIVGSAVMLVAGSGVASARSFIQPYPAHAYVPGGSSAAVATAIQRAGTHGKKPAHAGKPSVKVGSTSSQSPPPAPPGWMIGGPVGSATYLIPLPSNAQ